MRYSGIQPHYFPRLHYFARALHTDVFVLRDEVQFVSKHKYPDGKSGKSYQAHSPIKTSQGIYFLTIPINHQGRLPINETRVSHSKEWKESHLKSIRFYYGKSPHLKVIYPEIEMLISQTYSNLAELNISTFVWGMLRILGTKRVIPKMLTLKQLNSLLITQKSIRLREIRLSSKSPALRKDSHLTANEKILAIIKEIGADEDYCGGTAQQAYMDETLFQKQGVKIVIQNWKAREYPQLFSRQQGFIANLSILDLLLNVSPTEALEILNSSSGD